MATIVSVDRDENNHMYRVKLENESVLYFPYVWLRDNCRCSECYDVNSKYRLGLVNKLDPNISPISEEIAEKGKTLVIKWPEMHTSRYPISWLRRMQFSDSEPETVNPSRYPKRLWGSEMQDKIPAFFFEDIMNSDETLYDWLQALLKDGFAVIKKAPQEANTINRIGNRVFFLKQTHYGKVSQVINRADNTNIGFTTKALTLHVDLPYLEHSPGIELLHCVQQSAEGGDNQFADVFHCAEQLKKNKPDYYEILTKTLVDFRDWGVVKEQNLQTGNHDDHHLKGRKPILELSHEGQLKAVNYSDALRAPYFNIPVDKVHRWYQAYGALNSLMYSPENMIHVKLDGGEIACFDNQRLVHGRSAYKLAEIGKSRHMETGYIDWDQACSRMRVYREKKGEDVL